MKSQNYWLTNVRLESDYRYENGAVMGTKTELCHIRVEGGKIREVASAERRLDTTMPKVDGKGYLLLPSFIEKHVHLDKTFTGTPWRAVPPVETVVEHSELEKRFLQAMPLTTQERAEAMLEILLRNGSTHVRSHVDLYPEVGLKNLEAVKNACMRYEGKLSHEIVAFPQHGLIRSRAKGLIKEALREGASLVGGVDPATVDGDIEASLVEMMDLAVEGNVGVDLHLHDDDYLGVFTMKRLAALTIEAGWQGRVAISHAFGLGAVPASVAEEVAAMLAEAGITIITAMQHNEVVPPVPLLREKGVGVAVGCDNIFDSWKPFGNGDVLERLGRVVERFGLIDEYSLSQSLGLITGGITPLGPNGKRVWPMVGDTASMVLVDAVCSAEAVARRASRKVVFFNGAHCTQGSLY